MMALGVDSGGRGPPPAAPASAGTTATEVEFLWELRKYVLLLATLAASLTYSPGLNPPGGFMEDYVLEPAFALPSTPALQITDALRYKVFFYCNATAFIASIVIVILLLAHSLSRRRWWLRTLQGAMILDQFGLMGAYAAGSCRKVAMSAFVIALVGMVALYACAHVLIFALCASQSTAPEAPESVERARKCLLIFATLAVTVTYQTGLIIPDSFLSANHSGRFMVFFYFNTTAFVASLVVIMLLMSRTMTRNGFQSSALWVCTGAALIGLTGAFSVGCSRSAQTSIYVILLPVAVLFYIGIQALVFLCKPVENLLHTVQEKMRKYLRLDSMTGKIHHHHDAGGSNQSQQGNSDSDQLLQKSRMYLLLLGIFAATVTYQAGLNPPGGFSKDESYNFGVPILHIVHPGRYLVFFYCNATAFVASLVILILLLSNIFSTQGIKYCALQIAMILDLLGLLGAYAAGISQEGSKYVYFSVLVPVFLCICLHVLVPMIEVSPSAGTWTEAMREKLVGRVPEWLKKLFQLQTVDEDDNMERKLEKSRKLLLLLAILAANLTYQAGMNPPGGFWQWQDYFHLGEPILIGDYPHRYLAFLYCNTTAFVASLAIIMLLVNRKLSARPIQSHALRLCVILVLMGLVVAFFAGCFRQVSSSIHVFVLVFAVLCIAVLVAVAVSVCQLQKVLSMFGMLGEGSSYILPHTTGTGGGPYDPWNRKLPKYLLLLAVLVAAVTYQAAMNPPGGLWDDDNDQTGHRLPGDPILLITYPRRYNVFFYCNATSFMASLVIMLLLLIKRVSKEQPVLLALHAAMILDLFGLMGAYAFGSSWKKSMFVYTLALVVGVSAYIFVLVVMSMGVARWLKGVMNEMVERVTWCFFVDDL